METNYTQETPKMELSKNALYNLNEIRKWTNFLAILGFIFIALMVVLGFFISSIFSSIGQENAEMPFMGSIIGFIYLIIGLIYFFPIFYLYKFSTLTKKALENQNTNDLNEAFVNLRSHYRFIGILSIIMIGIYGLAFGIGVLIGFSGLM